MNVTVFVPINMDIKGENRLEEVQAQLVILDEIIRTSELDSDPVIQMSLVGEAEIIEDDVEYDD